MKEQNNQNHMFPDGFWDIPRPEISLKEALKDVSKINWEETLKDKKEKKEQIIIRSSNEIKSN